MSAATTISKEPSGPATPTPAGLPLEACGENIICRRVANPAKKATKIVVPGDEDKSPFVVVMDAGPNAFTETPSDTEVGEDPDTTKRIRFERGDVLLVRKLGGVEFTFDGHELLFLRPEHILARLLTT